ncbi:metal/formaldehyde-sensitive transcriptional repressor [Acinetobacter pollinis]|uniref:metal/formaldehyde-sensitive transcriptional repressor n=1 Tax=Acinetobacter pollinis TaxID=2605270 RepID=UPI0018A2D64E|nr:metal/formaldehyde-sensitive transcriptional repressor [Acinetobacter pollinis]MBF7690370.1 metal/formaldehyde-sensitive transcriptional repressor [Acinetobacter pollinis]MBF7693192.1 metal/formaldehyde-sensitive transcriptional repressor [Acinetobacter pollinis]MBF7697919.1 metal/formaldehyde-sensitive transcriptional repressor [Acinetobacter pollinis]MBF7700819.1 metal/formaldehyde-sensitive transcriptional repressor [Acinetobacter pollinis]
MSHLHENRKILNRLSRLQGQINAIQKTVNDSEKSCVEVLQQVAAVKGAVNGLMNELIEEHLKHHVLTGTQYNESEMEEFFKLLKKYRE